MINFPDVEEVDVTTRGTYAAYSVYTEGVRRWTITIGLHANVEMRLDHRVMVAWVVTIDNVAFNQVKTRYKSGFVCVQTGYEPEDILRKILADDLIIDTNESFTVIEHWGQ